LQFELAGRWSTYHRATAAEVPAPAPHAVDGADQPLKLRTGPRHRRDRGKRRAGRRIGRRGREGQRDNTGSCLGARPLTLISTIRATARTPSAAMHRSTTVAFSRVGAARSV